MAYGLDTVDNLAIPEPTGALMPLDIHQLPFPDSQICKRAQEYVQNELPPAILNHSFRVYAFGMAILKAQDYEVDPETFFLASMFHDIAASPKNIQATKLSFEFYGGILARNWFIDQGLNQDQADSIVEAIIRHTMSPGKTIHACGQLLQLATAIDVVGNNGNLVHPNTVDNVVRAFPRLQLNVYFSDAMNNEVTLKPGCITASRGELYFSEIKNNKLMQKYDKY
ncbi:hypothetical protein TRICI_004194 [Trichomonascus ciferrii]|uniref:HD domain-containing protein n=1 Tax=Trichomonascus ciferrii TaxID=44093 RepID=A0A642V1Z6_9ASCO|nr:hypothetical protein TRICI_004194 [Trichomonascus ciferrii]